VLDVSNLSRPVRVGGYQTPGPTYGRVHLAYGLIYVDDCESDGGLWTFAYQAAAALQK